MTTLTRAQVRELDRRAIEEYGVPGVVLMENAGRGAAEVLMRLNPERRLVVVHCGKGNNGGDGFAIARHLDIHGWPVGIWLYADPTTIIGDAAINFGIVAASDIPMVHAYRLTGDMDVQVVLDRIKTVMKDVNELQALDTEIGWAVDSLFGTGFTGAVHGPLRTMVMAFNKMQSRGVKVLAVDVPSGLDCDTGKPQGPTVRADHTVTFVAPKAGFANPEAKEWLGEVHVVGIGAPRKLLEEYGLQVP